MILLNRLLIGLLKIYKTSISPLLGSCCRFYPSCSSYAMKAYEAHSFSRASFLVIKRLFKCHPFHPGGVDCFE